MAGSVLIQDFSTLTLSAFIFFSGTNQPNSFYSAAGKFPMCRKSWVTQVTHSGSVLTLIPLYRILGQNQLQDKSSPQSGCYSCWNSNLGSFEAKTKATFGLIWFTQKRLPPCSQGNPSKLNCKLNLPATDSSRVAEMVRASIWITTRTFCQRRGLGDVTL